MISKLKMFVYMFVCGNWNAIADGPPGDWGKTQLRHRFLVGWSRARARI